MWNLKGRTWIHKDYPTKIVHPTEKNSLHMISGMHCDGWTYTVIRQGGANTNIEFKNYLVLLDKKLYELSRNP